MSFAKQLPPGLVTEKQILDEGYKVVKRSHGAKAARYYFSYDEDFPSDLISEYLWLQREVYSPFVTVNS